MRKILKQMYGWIFSLACNYLTKEKYETMIIRNEEIGRMLNHMINNPDKY